jgi:hypothetical protein
LRQNYRDPYTARFLELHFNDALDRFLFRGA